MKSMNDNSTTVDFSAGKNVEATRTGFDTEMDLYCAWFCPYAQRAWIALEYKGIRYRYIECALYDGSPSSKRDLSVTEKDASTPGFIACSPRGLVPAVEHGEVRLNDSLPVIEYIEEAFPDRPALLPRQPAERARIRMGISLWNEVVVRRFYSMLMSPPEKWELEKEGYLQGLETVVPLFSTECRFFSTHGFSLFECACLPWFQRSLSVLKRYRGLVIDEGRFLRLFQWYSAALATDAFSTTIADERALVENYIGYAQNTAENNCSSLNRV